MPLLLLLRPLVLLLVLIFFLSSAVQKQACEREHQQQQHHKHQQQHQTNAHSQRKIKTPLAAKIKTPRKMRRRQKRNGRQFFAAFIYIFVYGDKSMQCACVYGLCKPEVDQIHMEIRIQVLTKECWTILFFEQLHFWKLFAFLPTKYTFHALQKIFSVGDLELYLYTMNFHMN